MDLTMMERVGDRWAVVPVEEEEEEEEELNKRTATFKALGRVLKAAIASVMSDLLSVCPHGPRTPLGGFSSNFRHYWGFY
jgi:hypothetical protein